MPWQECSSLSERQEFVAFARQEEVTIAALCRHFGISRTTADTWLARADAGETRFADRSRRPHHSPGITPPEIEAQVLAKRAEHPAWGGRQLHQALARQGLVQPPAPRTSTAILRRQALLPPEPPPRDFIRFERETANALWPRDVMGHRALEQGRVHPMTVLDDHSRFALRVTACANEQQATVQAQLTAVFRRDGLPRIIRSDNGSPWAPHGEAGLTRREAWWLRLGIEPWHGGAYHPQTQGKGERFHGTIAAEVFAQRPFADLPAAPCAFDRFRTCDTHERPHEALADAVPAARYQPSSRPFPETLPEIVSSPDDTVRIVTVHGSIQWQGRRVFVSRGLVGQPVAVRPTAEDGIWEISFCHRLVARIDRRGPEAV